MSKEQSTNTKENMIDAFWQLLEEKPYNKITVNDIATRAGLNRNTFYYHFQDIPDLFEKAIEYWVNEIVERAIQSGAASGSDLVALIVEAAQESRDAVYHTYYSAHREALQEHMNRLVAMISDHYIDATFSDVSVDPEDLRILKKYNKCMIIGIIYDWLDSGMEYDIVSDTKRVTELYYNSIERVIRESVKKASE